ncbi:hypothetical protein CFC21_090104 [Triticum aestivum]|uniref:Uncharacterized protein n=2 Tax=Triticum aestivum TaxID=4565 RepID=A0A9R1JC60_WHEAT|nr:hypothetical protein CFC21_026352 [Triticum aestivum]KAF7086846.1 hypothetical protein CFC21_090104 [Triticum aestivum]
MAGRRRNRKTMQAGASVAAGDCSLKRKKASSSEAGDCSLKRKEASSSGAAGDCSLVKRKKPSAPEEGEIPEKRKKVFMPLSPTDVLLGKRPKEVLPAGAPEKRMKVVRRRLPQSLVEHIVANPYQMPVVPADVLARETNYYREFYAKSRQTADKIAAYQQGIIDQYKSFGYAEEDTEVTDEEEEDDDEED